MKLFSKHFITIMYKFLIFQSKSTNGKVGSMLKYNVVSCSLGPVFRPYCCLSPCPPSGRVRWGHCCLCRVLAACFLCCPPRSGTRAMGTLPRKVAGGTRLEHIVYAPLPTLARVVSASSGLGKVWLAACEWDNGGQSCCLCCLLFIND